MPAVDDAAKIVQQARATHLAALQNLRAAVEAEAKFDLGASTVVSGTGADTVSVTATTNPPAPAPFNGQAQTAQTGTAVAPIPYSGIRETAPPHVGPGETAAPHVPAPGHP